MGSQSQRKSVRVILEERGVAIKLDAYHDSTTLADVGKQLGPLSGSEALFGPLVQASYQLFSRLGVRTQRTESREYNAKYERVVAALALAIQREKLNLTQIVDTSAGSYFEIQLPIDMFSVGGVVSFSVFDEDTTTTIIGKCVIKGQLQAWGKGSGVVHEVLAGTAHYLTLLE